METADHEGPVTLQTSYRVAWFLVPAILTVLLAMIGGALVVAGRPLFGICLLIAAGGCLLTSIAAAVLIRRSRVVITPLPDGFRLRRRHTEQVVADRDVSGIAYDRQPWHVAGRIVAERRRLRIWFDVGRGEDCLVAETRLPVDGCDPLSGLLVRLGRDVHHRAVLAVRQGLPIAGGDWSMDQGRLHIMTSSDDQTWPISAISAVERHGHEIRIWKQDEATPTARIPAFGRNAWLLPRLLDELRPTDRAATPEAFGAQGLGRVLFERRAGWMGAMSAGLMGVICLAAALACLVIGLVNRAPIFLGQTVLFAVLTFICVLAALRMRRSVFRVHERGLVKQGLSQTTELRDGDITVFTYEAARQHSRGRYTGTQVTCVFADLSDDQSHGVFFSTMFKHGDSELETLRDRIAAQVARRLARAYCVSGRVQWTPTLWIDGGRLDQRTKRFWKIHPTREVLMIEDIDEFRIHEGRLHIWAYGRSKPVLSIKTSAPNFYAGLILLERLFEQVPTNRRPTFRATEADALGV